MFYINIWIRNPVSTAPHLVFDGVYLCLEALVVLWRVEESEGDGVAGVLEGDGRVLVRRPRQVDPVHAHDLVAALHLQTQINFRSLLDKISSCIKFTFQMNQIIIIQSGVFSMALVELHELFDFSPYLSAAVGGSARQDE